ncbi:protease [Tricholoma matsutake]|nr:protease [Tricholoma matsutake 945]
MHLSIRVAESDNGKDIATNALLDSGAGGVFINSKFVEQEGIKTYPLGCTIWATNMDGTLNRQGMITRCIKGRLYINGRSYLMEYQVARLGKELVILGLPWLREINLIIDWKKGTFEFQDEE